MSLLKRANEALEKRVVKNAAAEGLNGSAIAIFLPFILEFISAWLGNCISNESVEEVAETMTEAGNPWRSYAINRGVANARDANGKRAKLSGKERRVLRKSIAEELDDTPPDVCRAFLREIESKSPPPDYDFYAET